jgi:hypothetical protein
MQFPAQPKPRLALHETMQSRAQCPSLPRSINAAFVLNGVAVPGPIAG